LAFLLSIIFDANIIPSLNESVAFPTYKAAPAFNSKISLFAPFTPSNKSLIILALSTAVPPLISSILALCNPKSSGVI
jgi:hypothetical protein